MRSSICLVNFSLMRCRRPLNLAVFFSSSKVESISCGGDGGTHSLTHESRPECDCEEEEEHVGKFRGIEKIESVSQSVSQRKTREISIKRANGRRT